MIGVREKRKGEKKEVRPSPRFPTSARGRREAQRCHLAAASPRIGGRLVAEQTRVPDGCALLLLREMGQKLVFMLQIYVARCKHSFFACSHEKIER